MLSLFSPPFRNCLTPLPVGQIQEITCISVLNRTCKGHSMTGLVVVIYYVQNSLLYHLVTYIETLQCARDKNPETTTFDTSAPSDSGTLGRMHHFSPPLPLHSLVGKDSGSHGMLSRSQTHTQWQLPFES